MEFDIEIRDLPRVEQNLAGVAQKLKDNNIVAKAAVIVAEQMSENASGRPGPNVRTGKLKSYIETHFTGDNEARVGFFGEMAVHYAPDIEFGHRQTPGRYVPAIHRKLVADFVQAYPFIAPVIEQVQDKVGDVIVTFSNELGAEWSK